jgi:hypothetical protein
MSIGAFVDVKCFARFSFNKLSGLCTFSSNAIDTAALLLLFKKKYRDSDRNIVWRGAIYNILLGGASDIQHFKI